MTKDSHGRLPIFTTIGGIRSVESLKATHPPSASQAYKWSTIEMFFSGERSPENYDRYLGPVIFEPWAKDLVLRLAGKKYERILEIACGTGIVTRRLRDALPATTEIIATDLNPDMFEFAKPKFRNGENVLWQPADASALPFPNCSSDAAVCQFGVMFVPDKAAAMRESYRVLRSGGVFLFNVWDSFEANPFGQIAHTTIASFFDPDPPNSYKTSFGFH